MASTFERRIIPAPEHGWQGLVPNIKFLVSNPCGASPSISAETLAPALGELAIELIAIDPYSIARGYFRPRGRFGGCGPGRKKKIREAKARDGEKRRVTYEEEEKPRKRIKFEIPDTGREIGKMLPGSEFFIGRNVGKKEKWFWALENVSERFLWYYFILDIGKDAIYHWADGIFQIACNKDHPSSPYIPYYPSLPGANFSSAQSFDRSCEPIQIPAIQGEPMNWYGMHYDTFHKQMVLDIYQDCIVYLSVTTRVWYPYPGARYFHVVDIRWSDGFGVNHEIQKTYEIGKFHGYNVLTWTQTIKINNLAAISGFIRVDGPTGTTGQYTSGDARILALGTQTYGQATG